jgi:gentisate 1,2-dioxygenase
MSPRALAAPLHIHTREDEYSFVLQGRMGALLGDDVVEAGPGDLVFKPRNQWHTFWNAGDEPCRILEIIAPAGFENFFRELSDMGGAMKADPDELTALGDRYGLTLKPETVPELAERFGLRVGEPLSGGWTL